MDPSLALFISIFLILILIRRVDVGIAIFVGALTLGILTVGLTTFERLIITILKFETIRLILILILAFTLGYSMQNLGLLKSSCDLVSNLIGKLSIVLLPMIVGLLPMPGGALISAIMIKDLVKKYKVKPAEATFINYWFRHIWVPVWPLYPSIVICATIIKVGYIEIIKATYPIMIGMLLAGIIYIRNYFEESNYNFNNINVNKFKLSVDLLKSFYPILLIAILGLIFKLDLLITLLLALAILYACKRPSIEQLKEILRKTVDIKIVILVIAIMCYEDLITYTNSAQVFFNHLNNLNVPLPLAAFILSFIVGFSVGIEISYSAIALPLLIMFTGIGSELIPKNLMLVIAGGLVGVMLSPLHLCLILTSQYYSVKLIKVYKFLIPAAVILGMVSWIYYLII